MSTKIYAKLRKDQEPTNGIAENNGNYLSVQQPAGTRASPGRSGSNFSFLVQTETPGIILKKSDRSEKTYQLERVFERRDSNAIVFQETLLNQGDGVLIGKNLAVCVTGASGEGKGHETEGLLQLFCKRGY